MRQFRNVRVQNGKYKYDPQTNNNKFSLEQINHTQTSKSFKNSLKKWITLRWWRRTDSSTIKSTRTSEAVIQRNNLRKLYVGQTGMFYDISGKRRQTTGGLPLSPNPSLLRVRKWESTTRCRAVSRFHNRTSSEETVVGLQMVNINSYL